MAINHGYNRNPPPLAEKTPQANVPLTSAHDLSIAHTIGGMWAKYMATRGSWAWVSPLYAPRRVLTTADSAQDLTLDAGYLSGHAFRIPWYLQKGFNKIKVTLSVAYKGSSNGLAIAVTSQTLVTSVTTATTQYFRAASMARPTLHKWGDFRISNNMTFILTPNVGADRRIALGVKADLRYQDYPGISGGLNAEVCLYSMRAVDIIESENE